MKTVYKPWGKEEWIELNEFYCYKRIYINAGYKTSFQYHDKKYETNYIISGTAEVWLEDEDGVIQKKIMHAGEFFNVAPPKKHRVIALSDIILQEVSTPHVDDVIRIEDDTNRPDGKILSEHQTPAVLILSAGLGTRLKDISKNTNKVLVPIANKAVISHIIEKFPKYYDIIVAIGHKGNIVKDYCTLAHPERNITFVDVDDYTSDVSGPGYSALKCKHLLERPFYFITGDCLLESSIPDLSDNWLGVTKTEFPEKYSTALVNNDNVVQFKNKTHDGFDDAFIGIAGIKDYAIFWDQLEKNIQNTGEIVNAFLDTNQYPTLKAKTLSWFDVGNLDDLHKAQKFFDESPLSLSKDLGEITYKINNNFLKFFPNKEKLSKLKTRYEKLKILAPPGVTFTENFMMYPWIEGKTLYQCISEEIFEKFLQFLNTSTNEHTVTSPHNSKIFYEEKTKKRVQMFKEKYGEKYFFQNFEVNGVKYPSYSEVFDRVNFEVLYNNPLYSKFHGDLQFDNIIYDGENFFYIDWREDYGGNLDLGDVYYDLAKLMGGLNISYNEMKEDANIFFIETNSNIITQKHSCNLDKYLLRFIEWLKENNYDEQKIQLLVALIFLNMSPLHDEKFSKFLWFKSLTMLYDYYK